MNIEQVKEVIANAPKGANLKLVMERPVELRKAYKGLPLFKRTVMTVRLGVPNDGRDAVITARENGERPAENQGLKGLQWVEAPTLLCGINNPNQYYVRFEPSSNENEKAKTTFFVRSNGQTTVVDKADYEHMMLASETRPSRPYHGCFNTKIERIMFIGKKVELEELEDNGEMALA